VDPWGNPYEYNKFPPGRRVPAGARRDRFLVPINTTYDLYSKGKDGDSAPPLTARRSQDDVVRANDGGFIGLAARY
jgi:general secretion pathway protein G